MTDALAGKRVLVVEDEYFIASEIKRTLTAQGAVVVGPVGTLEEGLSLAEDALDAAVLDVNLEETMSYPIADRLRGRAVPYMFLTGYDAWALPHEHRETVRLAKPFPAHAIVSTMRQLFASKSVAV